MNAPRQARIRNGFYRLYSSRASISGYGEGDFIRLTGDDGRVWTGSATREPDNSVRYRFRDEKGRSMTGIADAHGLVLREESGKMWRGVID
ncbi:MAG: hypothetical protein SGI92_10960 [Bryobacteraceae bacterium]|nr:hypothetical protein [Bryobacteraceae bacterium]